MAYVDVHVEPVTAENLRKFAKVLGDMADRLEPLAMTQPPEAGDLRRLLAEATPGPWEAQSPETNWDDAGVPIIGLRLNSDGTPLTTPTNGLVAVGMMSPVEIDEKDTTRAEANAALIVAAVNALPGLLDELAALRSQAALSPAPSQGDVESLIKRLREYRPRDEWGDRVHHDICTEAADALAAMPVSAGYHEGIEVAAKVAEGFPIREAEYLRPMEAEHMQEHAEEIAAAIRALSDDDGKEGR